jgi:hypothetical protein
VVQIFLVGRLRHDVRQGRCTKGVL